MIGAAAWQLSLRTGTSLLSDAMLAVIKNGTSLLSDAMFASICIFVYICTCHPCQDMWSVSHSHVLKCPILLPPDKHHTSLKLENQ